MKTHLLNLLLLPLPFLAIACDEPDTSEDPREVEVLNLTGNHQTVQVVQIPLNTDGTDNCPDDWEIGDELQLEVAEVPNGEGTTIISWDPIMEDEDETMCESDDDCTETAPCIVLNFGANGGYGYSTDSVYWHYGLTCALGMEGDTVCGY